MREGAFAQYVAMPATNLVAVPNHAPLYRAARVEPMAVSWPAARLGLAAQHPKAERNALVLGGEAIGLGAALALSAIGVPEIVIIEPNAERRSVLKAKCGENALASTKGQFAPVVDAVGTAATCASASGLAQPGVILNICLPASSVPIPLRSKIFRMAAETVFGGYLGDMNWFEPHPLCNGAQAFAELRFGRAAAPKIVLDPWARTSAVERRKHCPRLS